jgi:hypothetical protein
VTPNALAKATERAQHPPDWILAMPRH